MVLAGKDYESRAAGRRTDAGLVSIYRWIGDVLSGIGLAERM